MGAYDKVVTGMNVWGLSFEGAVKRLREMGEVSEEEARQLLQARAAEKKSAPAR